MQKFIYILTLVICNTLYTQENKNQNFRVSLADLKLQTSTIDSTANAMVLYEYGNSYVDDNDFDLRTEKKRKIKIFNKEGFDHATVSVFLYKNGNSSHEEINKILATTYTLNQNGDVTKTQLDQANIFTENYNENFNKVSFTLPNIKPGSVITYSYTLRSPYMRKYHGWSFQSDIPKKHSEYHTSIPANWSYHIKLVGKKKLDTNTNDIKRNCLVMSYGASADCTESVYIMKDIPPFIEEDYMTYSGNYKARIEYELETFKGMNGSVQHYTKTWKDVDKELRTDIGRQLKKTVDVENSLPPDVINEKNVLKKATEIYHFVQQNYTWNGNFGIYKDISIRDALKNKSGNVSSINILLHNLLKQNQIKVAPVILSTRANGFATKIYPVITDFNYLIVQVQINDKTYFLDATDKYLNFGMLPHRCLNLYGRIIKFKGDSHWVDIIPSETSLILNSLDLNFNEDGAFAGHVKTQSTGYHALRLKKQYFSSPEQYIQNLDNETEDISISNFTTTTETRTDTKFQESYDVSGSLEDVNGTVYFNPFIIPFFTENPFKLQNRTYPIDFGYKDKYTSIIKLNLKDFYEVVEYPKNIKLALPFKSGDVTLSTSVLNNTINMVFSVNFREPFYTADYYPYLKALMNKVVDIQKNTLLVLKKKS